MNAVITERIRVDAHHAVHIIVPSLWELASTMGIDAPADYSVNFEQVLR
jgi:hypothetical protein